MAPKRVLSVGQCVPDQMGITSFLQRSFDVVVETADRADDALDLIRTSDYSLVLVNRLLDLDHSEGADIIRAIKGDDQMSATPVMLVSNFESHQEAAERLGAVPGFGKAQLSDPDLPKRFVEWLAD